MGKFFTELTDAHRSFIAQQKLFFVGSAPHSGRVNLSPKGLDCLRILSPRRVAYLDLTGSGNETSAHLHENRRITFMFCAFSGPPKILRVYGQGRTILPGAEEWSELRPLFPEYPGVRQLIAVDIGRAETSCGYAVPRMDYVGQRDQLIRWAETKGDQGVKEYHGEKNKQS